MLVAVLPCTDDGHIVESPVQTSPFRQLHTLKNCSRRQDWRDLSKVRAARSWPYDFSFCPILLHRPLRGPCGTALDSDHHHLVKCAPFLCCLAAQQPGLCGSRNAADDSIESSNSILACDRRHRGKVSPPPARRLFIESSQCFHRPWHKRSPPILVMSIREGSTLPAGPPFYVITPRAQIALPLQSLPWTCCQMTTPPICSSS